MKIRIIRNQKVVTDSDLAEALEISTKQLLNMFRRNQEAFSDNFYFMLTAEEQKDLILNYCNSHIERMRYARRLPTVFALPAIIMLLSMQSKGNKAAKSYRDKFFEALSTLPLDVFDPEAVLEKQ